MELRQHACRILLGNGAAEKMQTTTLTGGRDGILTRTEPIHTALARTELPIQIGAVRDIAPIPGSDRSEWLLLTEEYALVRLDADTREWTRLASAATHNLEVDRPAWHVRACQPRLHVSHRGEFAAIVNDYGRHGQIIDLRRDAVTLSLDCARPPSTDAAVYVDTVPFAFAFAQLRGRTVAIHRTDFNRLDLSDPATGELLSARPRTSFVEDGQSFVDPEHYLPYFHGALYVSPEQGRILDDGWIFHPMGVPVTWSLDQWLFANVWEPERGSTRRPVCARSKYWGHAVCWIDENRLALAGIGDEGDAMIDGARVFDIAAEGAPIPALLADPMLNDATPGPRELIAIIGPRGTFFSDGASLFSSDEAGLSRWDLSDGARTGHIEGFNPTHHHRGAGELAQLTGRTLVRWRLAP